MDSDMWEAPVIVPSITYPDLLQAIDWFARVFGFRERANARLTWPGGGMTWIEAGRGLFNISTPDATWGSVSVAASPTFVMKVYVEDLDSHFAAATAAGARIVAEPQNGFWGGRTYRALDHEGHRWEMSQTGLDLAAERWRLPSGVTRGVQGK